MRQARLDGIFAYEIKLLKEHRKPYSGMIVKIPIKTLDPKLEEEYSRVNAYYSEDGFREEANAIAKTLFFYLKRFYNNLKVSGPIENKKEGTFSVKID